MKREMALNRLCSSCGVVKFQTDFHKTGLTYRRSACKICTLAKIKALNTPEKRWQKKLYKLFKAFGISENYYRVMLNSQDHKCAICETPQSILDRFLDVDHNHKTGKIRGLLCRFCNVGLGNFFDSKIRLKAAIQYLEDKDNGKKSIINRIKE